MSNKSEFGAAIQNWVREVVSGGPKSIAPRLVSSAERPGGWSLFGKTVGVS